MLDFKEITDGTQFEIFVREMLIAYGLRAFWSGVGPDGGKDLLCIEPQKSFFEDLEKSGWYPVNTMLTAIILLV